jgi:hypothetical protein
VFADGQRDLSFYDDYDGRKSREYLRADAIGERAHFAGESCAVSSSQDVGRHGDAGHFKNVPGVGLVCVSDTPAQGRTDSRDSGQQTHAQRMQILYDAYDRDISQSWRGTGGGR